MKSGAGHPMGPFELADHIGWTWWEAMTMNIYQDMHQPHVSPPHTLTVWCSLAIWVARPARAL